MAFIKAKDKKSKEEAIINTDMICRIATPGKAGVPATHWYFDQEALRFLCASDIITFTF